MRKVDNLNKLIDLHQPLKIFSNDERTIKTKGKNASLCICCENEENVETLEEFRIHLQKIHEHLIIQRSTYLKRITYTLPQLPERHLRTILSSNLFVLILDKLDQC